MKLLNAIKKRMDNVAGKLLYVGTDIEGNILVIDFPDRRVMTFDSFFEQSAFDINHPYQLAHEYTRIMLLALGLTTPKKITLLGLGGGSLLRTLHHCLTLCEFQVIESRVKVLEIARRFFDIPLDERVYIEIGDAHQSIKKLPPLSSDIIFSDIYNAFEMHPAQTQTQFILDASAALNHNGWLVINYHQLPHPDSSFMRSLSAHYQTVLSCAGIHNNYIIFAGKAELPAKEEISAKLAYLEGLIDQPLQALYTKMKVI